MARHGSDNDEHTTCISIDAHRTRKPAQTSTHFLITIDLPAQELPNHDDCHDLPHCEPGDRGGHSTAA